MWTLAEAAKKTNDPVLKGIIETIITESDLLSVMPFLPIEGNGLTYNRETTLSGADFYSSGDDWVESAGTSTQYTAALKILGGDVHVDEFQKKTMANINDLEAINIEDKAKAVARTFNDKAVYGSATTNPKEFDGMHTILAGADMTTQLIHQGSGSTGAALSMLNVDALVDLIKIGKADGLMMNKAMRRRINAYYRSAGASFHMEKGEDGKMIAMYGDTRILINDYITFTETISGSSFSAKTGGATTSIFAVKFGPKAFTGCENGGIVRERLGKLERKDAQGHRVKWYCSQACINVYALGRIDGITNVAVTA